MKGKRNLNFFRRNIILADPDFAKHFVSTRNKGEGGQENPPNIVFAQLL